MTKIYAQGNYIVIEANNERNTFPKRDVRFKVVDEDGIYSLSSQELPIGDFDYSEVKKEDGSDYTTPLEFETFLFENTGNFNSGADGSPNYIPLTGTEEGKPVTGDIELPNNVKIASNLTEYQSQNDGFITSGIFTSIGDIQSHVGVNTGGTIDIVEYSSINSFKRLSILGFSGVIDGNNYEFYMDTTHSIRINSADSRFLGLVGGQDYSNLSPENKLIYAQRSYVERPETLINCLNNATPEQLSTIKSILGIV